jgi:hypothetical protein
MFIIAAVIAIALGFILKGNLANLGNVEIKGVYVIIIPFLLEFFINLFIRMGLIQQGRVTFILDLVIYSLLLIFVVLNKKNPFIVLMGAGFLLNAVAIFSNGGVMPVSYGAAISLGIKGDIARVGLYKYINSYTKFWILGDIIPFKLFSKFIFSIGDIAISLGMVLFIIVGMKKKENATKL